MSSHVVILAPFLQTFTLTSRSHQGGKSTDHKVPNYLSPKLPYRPQVRQVVQSTIAYSVVNTVSSPHGKPIFPYSESTLSRTVSTRLEGYKSKLTSLD